MMGVGGIPRKSGQLLSCQKIMNDHMSIVLGNRNHAIGGNGQTVDCCGGLNLSHWRPHIPQIPNLDRPVVRSRHNLLGLAETGAHYSLGVSLKEGIAISSQYDEKEQLRLTWKTETE